LRALGCPIVAVTSRATSTVAAGATAVLDLGDIEEACPMGLAPTASAVAMLAMCDALAMSVLRARPFGAEGDARLHPAGSLGSRLRKVGDVMRKGRQNPVVREDAPLSEAIATMTRTPGRPGCTSVTDGLGRLVGIFTDGDLRRLVESGRIDFTASM